MTNNTEVCHNVCRRSFLLHTCSVTTHTYGTQSKEKNGENRFISAYENTALADTIEQINLN